MEPPNALKSKVESDAGEARQNMGHLTDAISLRSGDSDGERERVLMSLS